MIYFDNSATTQIFPEVLDTYMKTSQRFIGNPSSLHRLGEQAGLLLQKSREQLAALLDVAPSEIFFTSGATEGNNWVIKGTAAAKRPFGNHIIISSIEHPSVSETVNQLAEQGFDVTRVPVDATGHVQPEDLQPLIREETILVSVMAVNNEVGSVQPIRAISECLAAYPNIHFHVDSVQAVGKVPVTDWLTDRVDFATFSAHKFHGPKGTGFVFWRQGRKIAPLLAGGGQENNQRSGTENVAGIVSMAKAFRLALTDSEQKTAHIRAVKDYLMASLASFDKVRIFSEHSDMSAPHILCFGLKGIRGEVLVHAFEQKEIYLSTTSACSSKKKVKSSTLLAMGVPEPERTTGVRLSLDETNTLMEAEQFMIVFKQLYQQFSQINS